jgi:hypothetical protein
MPAVQAAPERRGDSVSKISCARDCNLFKSQLTPMSRETLREIGKFLLDALRLWRQPSLAKCAAAVVYVGLALLTPGLRDLLLAGLPLAINWILERCNLPPLPVAASAPWWFGLVLVVLGLLFLMWQYSQRKIRVKAIIDEGPAVTIQVEVPIGDPAAAAQLEKILEQALKTRADKAPPPSNP